MSIAREMAARGYELAESLANAARIIEAGEKDRRELIARLAVLEAQRARFESDQRAKPGRFWRCLRLVAPWYVAVAVLGSSGSYISAASVLALTWLLNSSIGR